MQQESRWSPALVAALGLGAGAWASPLATFAQQTPDNPAAQATTGSAQPAAGGSDEIQEVVVTAERRSVSLQTTPIAMSAISGDQLANKQVETINDLQQQAPSFSVNADGPYQSLNIRGIGNSAVDPSIASGIAVFRDGLFEPEIIGLSEPFYDIADVEILRGPQGTFIGESSTGGAVLINSASPTFDGTNGFVDAQVGNYSDTKLTGAVNLPISDTLAARVAFNYEHRNSFYRDEGSVKLYAGSVAPVLDIGHVDDRNVRVSLLWKPNDSFQALLKIENNRSDTGGSPDQPNQNTFLDPATGLQTHSPYYDYSTHIPFLLNQDRTDRFYDQLIGRYGLDLRYTLPDGIVVRALTGYQHLDIREITDEDSSAANASWSYHVIGPDDNYYSEEVNVISPTTGPFTWIAGYSWFYRDTPVRQTFEINSPPYPPPGAAEDPLQQFLDIHAVQRTQGVFAQVNYQFIDSLQGQLGARYNKDDDWNQGQIVIAPPGGVPPFPVPLGGHFSDNVPTWKATLNWTPIDNQFFYGFVTRGYKSGGVNGGSSNFDPEHVTDYELGWKGSLFEKHLETQLGFYYMDYKDIQQPVLEPSTGQSGAENIGSAKIKGIEASAQGHFGGWNGSVSIAYNDSKLGGITEVAAYRLPGGASGPQCAPGQTAGCFDYTPYITTINNSANPFSPKVTANASLDYGIPLPNSQTLRPLVYFTHVDKQYASVFQTDNYFLMGPRNLLGATLSYEAHPWMVQLYGSNLTNQLYVSGYSTINSEFYGAPRQFGLRVRRTF